MLFIYFVLAINAFSMVREAKIPDSSNENTQTQRSFKAPTYQVSTLQSMTKGAETSKEVELISKNNLEKLVFDPSLRLISNKGGFTTSFAVDLPPSFLSLKQITFSYFTQFKDYTFLGSGWRWDIPFISEKQALNYLPFTVEGQLGNGDLIEVNSLKELVRDRVLSTLLELGESIDQLDYDVYQINYSSNENFFIKLSGTKVGWLVFKLSGESWIFNKLGNPIRVLDKFGHELILSWSADRLRNIKYSNDIDVSFTYGPQNSLELIKMTDGLRKRDFKIKYKDNQLIYAAYDESVIPAFQGSYKKVHQTIEVTDKVLSIKEYNDDLSIVVLDGHPKENVKFNFKKYSERINKILKNQKIYNNHYGEWYEHFVEPHHRGDNLKRILDRVPMTISIGRDEVELPKELRPYSLSVKAEPDDIWHYEIKVHSILNNIKTINQRSLFFIDIDNDGQKDIISCPIKSGSSHFASSVLDRLGGQSITTDRQSGPSIIGLGLWSFEYRKKTANFRIDKTKSFNCSQNSFFLDWDNDGRVDILNGHEVYLNKREQFIKQEVTNEDYALRFTSFVKSKKSKSKLIIKDINRDGIFEIYDSNDLKNRSVKLKQSVGVLSSLYSSFGGRIDIDYRMYKNQYLLPIRYSYIGDGKTETEDIYYLYDGVGDFEEAGFFEIVSVLKNTKGDTERVEKKRYCNRDLSLKRESRKIRGELCEMTLYSSVLDYHYFYNLETKYTESYEAFFERLNNGRGAKLDTGRIQPPTVSPRMRIRNLPQRLKSLSQEITPLEYDPLTLKIPRSQSNRVNSLETNYPHGKEMYRTYKHVNGREVLATSNQKQFYESPINGKKIFYSQKESKFNYDEGIISELVQETDGSRKITQFKFDFSSLEKGTKSIEDYNKSSDENYKLIYTTKYDYTGDLNRPSAVSFYLKDDLQVPFLVTEKEYDDQGRMVSSYQFGEKTLETLFYAKSPLIKVQTKNDVQTSFMYNTVSGEVIEKTTDHSIYRYEYTSDGLLLTLNINGVDHYELLTPKLERESFPKKLERSLKEIKIDSTFFYELDSMGRIKRSQREGSQYWTKNDYSLRGKLYSKEDNFLEYSYTNNKAESCSSETIFSKVTGNTLSKSKVCKKGNETRRLANGIESFNSIERGNIDFTRVGQRSLTPLYNDDSSLANFKELPHQWSNSSQGEVRLENFSRNSDDASKLNRSYNKRTNTLVDEYDSEFKFDIAGKFLFSKTGIEQEFILNEVNYYNKDRLIGSSTGHIEGEFFYTEGLLSDYKLGSEEFSFKYDEFSRLVSKSWAENVNENFYDRGLVSKISPFLLSVKRDLADRSNGAIFSNGVEMNYDLNELGEKRSVKFSNKGKTLFSSQLKLNSSKKVLSHSQSYFGRNSIHNFEYKDVLESRGPYYRSGGRYNPGMLMKKEDLVIDKVISLKEKASLSRNSKGQAESVGEYKIKYVFDNPVTLSNEKEEIYQFFTPSGEMKGSCRGTKALDLNSKDCWFKIDRDHFKVMGENLSLEYLDGNPIGITINSDFYPGIFDYRGSLIGLFDSKKGDLLFIRKYSPFGVKTVEFNPELGKIELKKAKELEKKIIWSFAHLFENPFLSGKGIYFSESRSLSAHHGEWLTFDPMLKWSPENLLSNPTDMNGFRYVNGDPVNFVDPSGHMGLPAVMALGGVAMGVGSVAGQYMADGNFSNAGKAFTAGFFTGAGTILFGGVGNAIVAAGGSIGLTTSLSINPVASSIGGLIGLGASNLISFADALGKDIMTSDFSDNFTNSGSFNFNHDFSSSFDRGSPFGRDSDNGGSGGVLDPHNYSMGDFSF